MKKIQLIKLISGSLKAKIITGVVATTIVTGGVTTSVVIHNKNVAENQRIEQEKISKEKEVITMTEKEEAAKKEDTNSSLADKDTKIEDITTGKTEEVKVEEKVAEDKVAGEAKSLAIKQGKTEAEATQVAAKAVEEVQEKRKEVEKTSEPAVVATKPEAEAPKPVPVSETPKTAPTDGFNAPTSMGGNGGPHAADSDGTIRILNRRARVRTYTGKAVSAMYGVANDFCWGSLSGDQVKNAFLGKYVEDGYKITEVLTTTTEIGSGEQYSEYFDIVNSKGGFNGGSGQKVSETYMVNLANEKAYFNRVVFVMNK